MEQIHKDEVRLKEAVKMSYDKAAARQQMIQQQKESKGNMSLSKYGSTK